jgi:hypothetical protein
MVRAVECWKGVMGSEKHRRKRVKAKSQTY